jgi:shikimate 5-dehydrogenase
LDLKLALKKHKLMISQNQRSLILGAGGVVPSIIFSLIKMKVSKVKYLIEQKKRQKI